MDYQGGPNLDTQVFKSRGSFIVEASEAESYNRGENEIIRKKQERRSMRSQYKVHDFE